MAARVRSIPPGQQHGLGGIAGEVARRTRPQLQRRIVEVLSDGSRLPSAVAARIKAAEHVLFGPASRDFPREIRELAANALSAIVGSDATPEDVMLEAGLLLDRCSRLRRKRRAGS